MFFTFKFVYKLITICSEPIIMIIIRKYAYKLDVFAK